jgi:hypothetical protein
LFYKLCCLCLPSLASEEYNAKKIYVLMKTFNLKL